MRSKLYILLFFLSFLSLSGCINPAKYLAKDEYLLYKKEIKGNQNISTEELEALQRQKPNRRVIVFPVYVWFYYWGKNTSDSARFERKIQKVTKKFDQKLEATTDKNEIAKIKKRKKRRLAKLNRKLENGSSLMQIIRPAAEPPVVYKDNLSKQTVSQMELYLRSKGYFNSSVSFSLDTLKTLGGKPSKKIKITYHVKANKPHVLGEINYVIEDSALSALVSHTKHASYLVRGENYDVDNMAKERSRLEKLFKDNGYYGFNRQYIEFEYDSTVANYTSDSVNKVLGERRVDVDVLIHNPAQGSHKAYTIDSVIFQLDNNDSFIGLTRKKKYYKGISYSYFKDHYSKKVLNYKVFLKAGEKYSLQNAMETQRQLLNLDNFRFVNIVFDTTGGKFITRIITSPAKKYTTSEEMGISVSQKTGPTANISFKIRNVLNGFENFESSLRYTFEGVASSGTNREIYRSQELTATASLVFPHTVFPFKSKIKRTLNKYNPKTRLLYSYTYISRPDYTRSNLRGSFIYSWQKGLYNFFSFSPVDINIVDTLKTSGTLRDSLSSWKGKGYPLAYSFGKAFVSNINASYTFNNYIPGTNKKATYFNIYAESGGTLINLLDKEFVKGGKILDYPVFSYLKFATDIRRYIPIGVKNTLATRINLGFAKPTLSSNRALPYEKYFFAGGSTSIRAWKPRQLGPGSFNNYDPVKNGNKFFENPGDILIEMSAEYRFNIIDLSSVMRIEGAWFLDAGNVWNYYKQTVTEITERGLEKKEIKPGAVFSWNRFYREIAIGSGLGLRFNFSFFIVRFDAAYRIMDPAEPLGKRLVVSNIGKKYIDDGYESPRKNPNYLPTLHIGVNYPF